jgi:hypothetical protein
VERVRLAEDANLKFVGDKTLRGSRPLLSVSEFTLSVTCYTSFGEAQRDAHTQIFSLIHISHLITMSDYTLENREVVVQTLLSRVIENCPLRELIRVYSEACTAAIANLSDADVVRSISAAGHQDILEAFELEVPAPEAEGEAAAE